MSNTETDTPHEYTESRRYVCTSCDTVVRARWDQWGDGYPGYFEVGCDCTIVPVVPEMSQAETPDEWRVERPECCRGVDVKDLEECYVGVSDYRCPDCGATYRWDGTMSTAPGSEEEPDPPDGQQLLTDGGRAEDDSGGHHTVGEFLGEFAGLKIRGVPNGGILEIHGVDGMAAVEITDETAVDGLTEAAAEIQMAIDDREGSQ